MTNAELIPDQPAANVQTDSSSFSNFLNPQLVRLQKQSMGKEKGKSHMPEGEGAETGMNRELSLRKINKQIQRMEGGDTSKNAELQIQQRQIQMGALSSDQGVCQGQSGADVQTGGIILPLPTVINEVTVGGRCNNTGDRPVQSLAAPVQQSTTLSDPVQPGSANQPGSLSQLLYTPGEEMIILRQRYGPDLSQQVAQHSQLLRGQNTTFIQHPPFIPSSLTPDASCQHEPANPILLPNSPSLLAQTATHITQTTPSPAISAAMEDKISGGKALLIPRSPQASPPPPSRRLPASPLRSSPKRPSESLLDLPLSPVKKLVLPADGGSAGGSREDPSASSPLGAMLSSGQKADHGQGILGAPPTGSLLRGNATPSGGLGAATRAPAEPAAHAYPNPSAVNPRSGDSGSGFFAYKGSCHRSGNSRRDVPPTGGFRGMRPHTYGLLCNRARSSTWQRDRGTNQMGSSTDVCGGSSQDVTGMDLRPGSGQGGLAMAPGNDAGSCYDPWPIRTPSVSVTADSDSSRQGAFSPPGVDRLNHMDLDVDHHLFDSRA